MRCVFDFSRVPGPSAERIITDGGEGVLVYSFNARQSDELLNEYRSAGLHVVWIWERNTDSIFDGYDFAVDECGLHEARVQPGELTYVACDTNDGGVAGRDLSPFLQGWSDTTREPRFGVYGSSGAIRQAQKFGGKCSRFWGVVNWINGGGPNNAPENISYWTNAHAHLIQLIGSPIDDTDQNMILQDDWWSLMSYRMPFDGDFPVSSPWGQRDSGFHYGIDYGLPAWTPLVAIGNGQVVYATNEGSGFGNTVTIQLDGGPKVGYGHMARIDVAVGQRVVSGQPIGMSGGGAGMVGAGTSTGPHLHLWMGAGPNPPGVIDPTPLLTGVITGDDDMTQEQMDTLGVWMKQQRELMETTFGQWLKDVEGRINAHTDSMIGSLSVVPGPGGTGVSEERVRAIFREELNRTKLSG